MIVSRLLAAAFVLAAGRAFPQEAFDVDISGIGQSRDVHCEDGQSVRVSGTENRIEVTGKCRLVLVDLADNKVNLERADTLRVFGSKQEVGVRDTVLEVEVHGADHAVTASLAGEGAAVRVSGSQSRLTLTLRAKANLAVTGADHEVTYRLAPQTPKPAVQVSGANNRVHEERKTN